VPRPDPTVLTTQQLTAALSGVRDYTDGEIKVLVERLRAIDRASEILAEAMQGTINRDDLQRAIDRVDEVRNVRFDAIEQQMTEKFHSINVQFAERDTRQERESRDNKVAVDAAFAAQKEAAATQDSNNTKAIDKSEKGTAETISKLQDLTSTQDRALADRIDGGLRTLSDKIDDLKDSTIADLKTRLAAVEARRLGSSEHQSQSTQSQQSVYTALGVFVALIIGVVSIYLAVHK